MDGTDRRAWLVSLVLHGVLVAAASIRIADGDPPPPSDAAVPAAPDVPTTAPLILAEDAFVPLPLGQPLPDRPLADLPILHATSLAPRAEAASPGPVRAEDEPPTPARWDARATPILDALRGQARSAPRDWDEDNRRTAATTVQIFIENTFRARWAGLRTRITRRDLILWLRVDAGGRIASGGLFQCSTGLADLDRAIERWLTTEVTGLPRIEAGVDHFIRVELPR